MVTALNSFRQLTKTSATFVDILSDRSQSQPSQIAYTFIERGDREVAQLTYQKLDEQARAIAANLQALGVAGQSALLLYPPGLDFIAGFFGCMYASVIAVPAYPPRPNQKLTRLQAIVKDCQATVVLTTTALQSSIARQIAQAPDLAKMHWVATDNLESSLASNWQPPLLSPESLAFLQYTSGSTGTPKGVMVSHGNLLHNSEIIYQGFGHTPESRGVIWLPPYHDMGLIGGILQPMYGGFPAYLMAPVDFLQQPWRWLEAISRYRATTSGGPNFAYDLVCRKATPEKVASLDLSCWKVAFTGAEPVRAATLDKMATTFAPCGFRQETFYPCYGMAETTLMVSGGLVDAPPVVQTIKASSLQDNQVVVAKNSKDTYSVVGCGKSLGGQQVRIVNPHSLQAVTNQEVGEIWVKGPSVAQGYWNQPEQTQETFQAYIEDTGEGPFLRTGDLGFLQDGELFITGRIKEIIIIGGQNYYPQDIELTVQNNHPALRPNAGAAFSVEVRNAERLVVVQEVERTYLRKLDVREVIESIRHAVTAEYTLPLYAVVLVKPYSIPTTSSGKIQRYACRNSFLNGSLNVIDDWSENPQNKTKFLHLQNEVDSMLEKLAVTTQKSN
ncbi:MAG: fatty acyl-AMP ligase [Chroococcales cyanobacterium]